MARRLPHLAAGPPAAHLAPPSNLTVRSRTAEAVIVATVIAAGEGLVALAAALARVPFWAASSYLHWDSGHYMTIARTGYQLNHCSGPGRDPTTWCGNAGWFPGFPLLIRVVARLPLMTIDRAAALVPHVAFAASVVVVWCAFLRRLPRRPAVGALALFVVFPGAIYFRVGYPIALAVLGAAVVAAALVADRPLVAGVAAAGVVACYPSGVLLLGLVVVPLVHPTAPGPVGRRAGAALRYALPPVVTYAAVLVMYQVKTGYWNAWFMVQAHYDHDPRLPPVMFWDRLRRIVWPHQSWERITSVQNLVVATMVVAIVATSARDWRRRDVAVGLVGVVVFWLGPWFVGGQVSTWRQELLIAPFAVILARRRTMWAWAAVAAAAPLSVVVGRLFFENRLH